MLCFICLESYEAENFPWIPCDLKRLVVTTSQLLKLDGILDEDWDFLEELQSSVCCLKCCENLETIVKTYEILVKTKENLKECLDRVETAVGNSVKPELDEVASFWGPGCWKFRNQLKFRNEDPNLNDDDDPLKNYAEVKSEGSSSDYLGDLIASLESAQDPLEEPEKRRGNKRKHAVIAQNDKFNEHMLPSIRKRRKPGTGSSNGDEDWFERSSESEHEAGLESENESSRSSGSDDEQGVRKTKLSDKDSCRRTTCTVDGCKLGFKTFKVWKKHVSSRHPSLKGQKTKVKVWKECPTMWICSKCPSSPEFTNSQHFISHWTRLHQSNKTSQLPPWSCDMCQEKIPRVDMANHVQGHVGEYALKCPNPSCIFVACTIAKLKNHFKNSSKCTSFNAQTEINTDSCDICDYKGHNARVIYSHQKLVHVGKTSKPHTCPVSGCAERFSHRQSVYFHISEAHSTLSKTHLGINASSQKCSNCGQHFSQGEISSHMSTCQGISSDTMLTCSHCPFKAPNHSKLLDHFAVHFKAGIPISCYLCPDNGIFFRRLPQLRGHFVARHRIGESFTCDQCSQEFKSTDQLRLHVKIAHSSEPCSSITLRLKCKQCPDTDFANTAELTRHKIQVHGAEPFKCDQCSKHFTYLSSLQSHKLKCHTNKPEPTSNRSWNCDMCCEKVLPTNIRQHVENHVGDYSLPCPNPSCPLVFCTLKFFNAHVGRNPCQGFNNKDSSNTCQICSFTAANITSLHSHLLSVHEAEGTPKTLPCPVSPCPEVFAHRQSVTVHISKTHSLFNDLRLTIRGSSQNCPTCRKLHPHADIAEHFQTAHGVSPDSIVSCSECPYKAPTRGDLINHLVVHFREGGKVRIGCDLCPKSFTALKTIRRHYLSEHQIGESFVCEFCSSSYPLQSVLKQHIKRQHDSESARRSNSSKSFPCDECSRQDSSQPPPCFPTEAKLIQHKITSHGRDPYKCDTCGKTFLALQYLQTHINTVHKKITSNANFPCDMPGCSQIFSSRVALRKHKMTVKHAGKTNAVKCDQCSASFNTIQSLRGHKKQVHAEAMPFVCDQCGKAFVTKRQIQGHSRTHTGERPFVCPTCQKGFTFKVTLDYHLKHVHPQTKLK